MKNNEKINKTNNYLKTWITFVIIICFIIFIFIFIFFIYYRKKKCINYNNNIKNIKMENIKNVENIKIKYYNYNIIKNNTFNYKKYNYEELNKNKNFEFNTTNYFDKIELFLKNYKYIFDEKLKKYISIYIKNKKPNIVINKTNDFKNFLKNTWKLGLFILNSLETQSSKELSNYIVFFKSSVHNLFVYCKKEKDNLLNKYDWFLFASYYPTVLLYKLTIENKLNKVINKETLNEIFYYIPKINTSINIERFNSNLQILSINFIMANIFKLQNDKIDINNFLQKENNTYNFDSFLNNYVKTKDGLYPNGGYIIHNNLCSYNYLLASLYPNIFYNLFFNTGEESIERILLSLFRILNFKIKKTNPSIISRFGNFNELYKNLYLFNYHVKKLNVFKNSNVIKKLNNYIYNIEIQNNKIEYFKYFDIIIVNYENWCMQVKNNNYLAYGEIDKQNNNILKQNYMNKIILFEGININNFLNHSKYPGVMFYKTFKDNSEVFKTYKNTKTFFFENANFSSGIIFENIYFIYNEIKNKEIKLEYKELIIFLPEGIIVGYFDIDKYLSEDLFLCLNNNIIYEEKIKYGILYSDIINNQIINENNKYHYIKINKNIIYYNFYIDKLFKLNFYNNKNSIHIVFSYNKNKIDITIKKNLEIFIKIISS